MITFRGENRGDPYGTRTQILKPKPIENTHFFCMGSNLSAFDVPNNWKHQALFKAMLCTNCYATRTQISSAGMVRVLGMAQKTL